MMLSAKRKKILLKNYLVENKIFSNKLQCSNCGAKNVSYEKYLLKDMTENKFIIDNTKKIFEDLELREIYMTGKQLIDGKEYDGEMSSRLVFNNVRSLPAEKDNIKNIISSWNAFEFLRAYISKKYQIATDQDKTDYTDIETYTKKYIENYQKSKATNQDGHLVIPTSLEIHDVVTDIYNKHISNEHRIVFMQDRRHSDRIFGKKWMEKNHQNLKPFCANCQ